ncbi:MAG TPA: hypothetical protein VFQ26_01425, partial [Nitrospiraceae bacterium]|nr:hypothetical protein [Nitrospiraceae bacterium]
GKPASAGEQADPRTSRTGLAILVPGVGDVVPAIDPSVVVLAQRVVAEGWEGNSQAILLAR